MAQTPLAPAPLSPGSVRSLLGGSVFSHRGWTHHNPVAATTLTLAAASLLSLPSLPVVLSTFPLNSQEQGLALQTLHTALVSRVAISTEHWLQPLQPGTASLMPYPQGGGGSRVWWKGCAGFACPAQVGKVPLISLRDFAILTSALIFLTHFPGRSSHPCSLCRESFW